MKTIKYLSTALMGCIIAFTSCNNSLKQSANTEDSLEVENLTISSDDTEDTPEGLVSTKYGSMDDAKRKAEKSLAQANKEIEKEHNKIDDLFDRLIEAKRQLADAEERVNKDTSGHTSVQQEFESSEKALQVILDDVNRQYAKIYGFLLTVSNCEDLAEAVKDKVKSHIAVEILQQYKRKALEEIDNKYIGEP